MSHSKLVFFLFAFLCWGLFGFRNVGSAKTLSGSTYSFVIFVSDANHDWSRKEKKEMMALIHEAQDWLVSNAETHDKALSFHEKIFGWRKDIKVSSIQEGIRSGYEDVNLVQKITSEMGMSAKELMQKYSADNYQMLFVLKKDGASYAFPYNVGMAEQYYLEGIALYQNFGPDYPNCASCIAHEILHIFGAHDYYKTFQTTVEQEEKARREYPDSVMLRTSYDINDVNIDPITQWRVGWSAQKPADADFFNPVPY